MKPKLAFRIVVERCGVNWRWEIRTGVLHQMLAFGLCSTRAIAREHAEKHLRVIKGEK